MKLLKFALCSISVSILNLAHAQAIPACRLHSLADSAVPECPSATTTILPDTYPALAVSISEERGGVASVIQTVHEILDAQAARPPQIFLNVSVASFAKIVEAIEGRAQTLAQRKLWKSALTRLPVPATYQWMQDIIKPVITNGAPAVRVNGSFVTGLPKNDYRQAGARIARSLAKSMNEVCAIGVQAPYQSKMPSSGGRSGGNVTGGPNNFCFVGEAHLSDPDWSKLAKDLCGSQPVLKIPSEFLSVGHADEVIATLRTGNRPCDSVILLASPDAALTALRKNPLGLAFDLQDEFPGWDKMLFGQFYDGLCAQVAFAPSDKNGNQRAAASENPCREKLKSTTNKELIRVLETNENFRIANEEIQRRLTALKGVIKARFAKAQCPNIAFVDVPVLYSATVMQSTSPAGQTVQISKARALHSPATNGQQFSNRYLLFDPGNQELREDVKEKLGRLQAPIEARFIQNKRAHIGGGELHCSVNAVRYCRPSR